MNQRNLEQQSNEETCKFFVLEVKWGGVDQVRKANVTTQEASERSVYQAAIDHLGGYGYSLQTVQALFC